MRHEAFEYPLYLIHWDGRSREFHDIGALRAAAYENGGTVGLRHSGSLGPGGLAVRQAYDWIIRDCLGRVVDPDSLRRPRGDHVPLPSRMYWFPLHAAAFSDGSPVPGTGRRRGGHWRTRPRHLCARRESSAAFLALEDFDGDPPACVRRMVQRWECKQALPPTGWDDAPIASLRDRCWKGQRRTRWWRVAPA